MSGVKVLHGLDKVIEGGAVVLTLKDQSILANGDLNEGEPHLAFSIFCSFYVSTIAFITLSCIYQMLICLKMLKLVSRSRGMMLIRLQRGNQGLMRISNINILTIFKPVCAIEI